jgi:hypothetical protein
MTNVITVATAQNGQTNGLLIARRAYQQQRQPEQGEVRQLVRVSAGVNTSPLGHA